IRNTCFKYTLRDHKCISLFDDLADRTGPGMTLVDLVRFNYDGSKLLFHTMKKGEGSYVRSASRKVVRIWSYIDKELQSTKRNEEREPYLYLNVIDVKSKVWSRLTEEGDIILDDLKLDKAIVWHIDPGSDMRENSWNSAAKFKYYLISAKDGTRVSFSQFGSYQGKLSPNEKFVIFTDKSNYYSYEISSKECRNITAGLETSWLNLYTRDKDSTTREIAGWLRNDEGVLVYDKYDIWLLDPKGIKPAVNVTNGYGRKHNIIFHLGLSEYNNRGIRADERVIINGTGVYSKANGFFSKKLNEIGNPDVLTFGSYVFHMPRNGNVYYRGQFPVKAKNNKKYIVSRMTATESLNYFFTTDFKIFTPLSNQYPEKSYNWYTSELYSWRTAEGVQLQGVLYKPENFDSTKKYPLILNCYEKPSYNLNVCLVPSYSSDAINIPTYVSNGYLVFTPDVNFMVGDPLQGSYNSVVSATAFLSKLSFVNSKKIGIQGFSFGGVQTYYLITNTSIFAAACAASGLTDFISAYGTISNTGYSLQGNFESGGQNRMGGTPWDKLDMYIKNSAIFKANCVTTPLLMMHTTEDGICPFSQALEFFTALRRLRKKVWLLEYIGEQHSLHGLSAIDFDIRMAQFFDYYLKDGPIPQWMKHTVSTE
ncbi:alpha/beta hydrolase family protein, partial [Chitinophaga sp.]|uniref:alpha/beta hydrolase family protein n=1 Tax=Chitinophaga sp. TaxID=1869181 RepID=UPI002F9444EE